MGDKSDNDSNESLSDDDNFDFVKKNQVVICIDTHPSMFEEIEDEDKNTSTPFRMIIEALFKLVDKALLSKITPPFCILIVNNENSVFSLFKENVIDVYKKIEKLNELSDDELKSTYETNDINLSKTFHTCLNQFKSLSNNLLKKLIFLTNDDDPAKSPSEKFTALNQAKNFAKKDIFFDLIVMKESFNYTLFYNEMYQVLKVVDIVETICLDSEGVYANISRYFFDFHVIRNIKFYLFAGNNKDFIMMKKHSAFTQRKLYANDFTTKDGDPVRKAKDEVTIDSSEVASSSRGVFVPTKLSYKQKKSIRDAANDTRYNKGYSLIYLADETTGFGESLDKINLFSSGTDANSLNKFNAYWQHCLNKKKVLVCVYKPRNTLKLVEMVPKLLRNKKYFLVKTIPFANEVFDPDLLKKTIKIEAASDEKKALKDLIEVLNYDFDPSYFQDKEYIHTSLFIKKMLLDSDLSTDIFDTPETEPSIIELAEKVKQVFSLNTPEAGGQKRKRVCKKR